MLMRYTFKNDDCMVITIPLGSIKKAGEGKLMPENFTCRFKDVYKVFLNGRPKILGAAQIVTAIFIICLGSILISWFQNGFIIIPSALFILCGVLTFASGYVPFMPLMKMSFSFNVIGIFSAVVSAVFCVLTIPHEQGKDNVKVGLRAVMASLYGLEFVLALIIVYWESKAVCRAHFNTLPMITLKQDM